MNAPAELKQLLCEQWCAGAHIDSDEGGLRISMPLIEADGDHVTVWLKPTLGGWRLSDMGSTFMRLSYSVEFDSLEDGQRLRVIQQIAAEEGIAEGEGELFCEATEPELGQALMRLGQAILRIGDIRLWTRNRVASTFYADLEAELREIAAGAQVQRDYVVPGIEDAASYPVDFAILGKDSPLYVFGVPNSDKAKLATIVMQHLRQSQHRFDSLVVAQDFDALSKHDRRRLMNAANDVVPSLTEHEALVQKVRHRIA